MTKNETKMQLPKITADDLFSSQEDREKIATVRNINIDNIVEFPDHPFKVKQDDNLNKMIDSINEMGVLNPVIVRPLDDGKYQMISGHRRRFASKLANKTKIPAIVKDLTDDEAIILMVDSNIQREELLPSEKAFAYKMKLDAIKHQGIKKDVTSVPLAQKLDGKTSRELVADDVGESQDQIRRYIRLTELIPELLQKVDDKVIAFRPAVELSYLSVDNQTDLLDIIDYSDATPSLAQAIQLKKLEQSGELNADIIDDIMSVEKPNQVEKVKINKERVLNVLPKGFDMRNLEERVIKALILLEKTEKKRDMDAR